LTTVIVTHDPAIARVVDRVISIRDGKTSTETVRQPQAATFSQSENATWKGLHEHEAPAHHAEQFEERALLDMAGRVQIPREYLERRGIKTRAVVQLVEEGVLLRPAREDAGASLPALSTVKDAGVAGLFGNSAQDPLPPRARPWWKSLLGGQAPPSSARPEWESQPVPGVHAVQADLTNEGEPSGPPPAPEEERPPVEAAGLRRVYRVGGEAVPALQGIDLTIDRRRFVVFRGRSGSGKTTLLNLLGGLDQPTAGRVLLFGQDLQALSDTQRTQLRQERVGFVFQAFSLMPTFSALENVEMLLRAAQIEEEARRTRALHCLALVGLRRWADHRPFEMSGGQQQRLSIARALARRPQLIIADEPTSNLDSETGKQILSLFQQLVAEEGVTVLMASHDPASEAFATDTYELSDGRIVARS
jgi:ABC-type lipoprotein export system ATPase subunit